MTQDGHHHLVIHPPGQVQVVWHTLNKEVTEEHLHRLIHLYNSKCLLIHSFLLLLNVFRSDSLCFPHQWS